MRLPRGSFRQLLLLAFLLIAVLLGGVALRAVFTFDGLMARSLGFSARTLQLNGAAQALSERSATMERAARQSLILNDSPLRRSFVDAARQAREIVADLQPADLPPPLAARWRNQLETIDRLMEGAPDTALERERNIAGEFRELDALNVVIAQQMQAAIEKRRQALNTELDASRAQITRQVIGMLVLALLLAVALGIWLARPFKRVERAIVGLGENRLDQPIEIQGPSDVHRIGQQLDWLRLRLSELDADKARFLRHISHELKTPLAALREGVSLLEEGVAGELNDNQREIASILRQNTVQLQSQIEALLRFNAAAFEARQLQRERVDLLQLIEAQVDAQRLQWRANQLVVQVEGEPVTARVDPAKIGTALANLLSNAIRFSPPGGRIVLRLQRLHHLVLIDVIDAGPGVADADRDRVFEPFYRGQRQPEGAVKGTGIGLSIVHEYIAAHGGKMTLLAGGPGAHFRIELPHVP
ncbi:sensor histidine kinase KdpD [Pseudorhodoferax sp. Leaf267]|uniref:sensor histidine kinase n=1 Tax=Pseudorhodoferax sp. Leaf267 TaxID=1736316 RepID=UPI0006F3882F|nr:ATP-binding protein [Pseudorhodoferax sp. Leaf267]KQP14177.1 histidine kinase [Pseudorhodoferax sp. Leaf267]